MQKQASSVGYSYASGDVNSSYNFNYLYSKTTYRSNYNHINGGATNKSIPFANTFVVTKTTKPVWGFNSSAWGRIYCSVTVSTQTQGPGIFYSYGGYDSGRQVSGVGMNLWGWYGFDICIDKEDITFTENITPWLHGSISIGANGITLSSGIIIRNTSYDFHIGIGLAPIVIVVSAIGVFISGGSLIDVFANWWSRIFA